MAACVWAVKLTSQGPDPVPRSILVPLVGLCTHVASREGLGFSHGYCLTPTVVHESQFEEAGQNKAQLEVESETTHCL